MSRFVAAYVNNFHVIRVMLKKLLLMLFVNGILSGTIPLDGRVLLNPCTGETLLYGDFDVIRNGNKIAFHGILTSDGKYRDYIVKFEVIPESLNQIETYKVPVEDKSFAIMITVDRVYEKVTKMEINECS